MSSANQCLVLDDHAAVTHTHALALPCTHKRARARAHTHTHTQKHAWESACDTVLV